MWYYTRLCAAAAVGAIGSATFRAVAGCTFVQVATTGVVGVSAAVVAAVIVVSGVAKLPAPAGPGWHLADTLASGWILAVAVPAAIAGDALARTDSAILGGPVLLVLLWRRRG